MQGAWVQSLVGELGSCMQHSVAYKKIKKGITQWLCKSTILQKRNKNKNKLKPGNSLAVQWLRLLHFHCRGRVGSLVGELRSRMPLGGQNKKKPTEMLKERCIWTPVHMLLYLFLCFLSHAYIHIPTYTYIFKICGRTAQHAGSYFEDQGWNLRPLQWKRGVLTAWLPGKSRPHIYFKKAIWK